MVLIQSIVCLIDMFSVNSLQAGNRRYIYNSQTVRIRTGFQSKIRLLLTLGCYMSRLKNKRYTLLNIPLSDIISCISLLIVLSIMKYSKQGMLS